ncbi:MAG: YitT family protein [Lawsonibacter sp.]
MRIQIKTTARDLLLLTLGILIYSIGTHCFISPANIAPGGVIGIALMINHITGLPIGAMTLCMNIPLLVIAWFHLSKRFVLRTGFASVLSSLTLDLIVAKFLPMYTGDLLLSGLYGGILVGVGMAIIFQSGSTTGGSDIVGYLLQKRFPYLSIGRILMVVDGIVLSLSIPVFQTLDSALFGLISLYAQTKIIDLILYGSDVGSKVTIITRYPEEISRLIISELDRTATILSGKGAYSQKNTGVVLCMVRNSEFSTLKRIIQDTDKAAFMMVTEGTTAFGLGFKSISDGAA